MRLRCLLIMEADVMVSDQYDQFRVGGMSEHSVEAAHIVLPVLCRKRQTVRQTRAWETNQLILGKVGRNNGISEGWPSQEPRRMRSGLAAFV